MRDFWEFAGEGAEDACGGLAGEALWLLSHRWTSLRVKMQSDPIGLDQRYHYAFGLLGRLSVCAGSSRVLGSLFESDACLCWDCDVGLG